ncbi:hypothetical protein [Oceaniferula spumae]|uniref:hypothetical protein n=1 Tax=Oceaniferula spumae TaxID=2979115 RepID=UPI003F4ED758
MNSEVEVKARFYGVEGVHPKGVRLSLSAREGAEQIFPGVVATVIGYDGKGVPAAELFDYPKAPVNVNVSKEYGAYPNFRTGTSIVTPPLDDASKQWTVRPHFFNTLVASASFSANGKLNVEKKLPPRLPLGDLGKGANSALRVKGMVLVEKPGRYVFRMECNAPVRMVVGEKSVTLPEKQEIEVDLKVGPVAVDFLYDQGRGVDTVSSVVSWKVPGSEEFVKVPDSRFAHRLDRVRHDAFAKYEPQFMKRFARVSQDEMEGLDDLLESAKEEVNHTDVGRWQKMIGELVTAYRVSGEW